MVSKEVLLQDAARQLNDVGVEDARSEARRLLCWALGVDLTGLFLCQNVEEEAGLRFQEALKRRLAREPLAFIVGEAGFWTLDLYTSPATLIPRGDSEALIEALLAQRLPKQMPLSILDLGTGTGCLLLAALSEFPLAWGLGVDLSPDAAALAAKNARRNALAERCAFIAGDWAGALSARFDIVFSNPPYIESDDIAGLMPEVAKYEPHRALDGGQDGLDAYRLLCRALPSLLNHDGIAILEMGIGQINAVSDFAQRCGLREIARHRDLGGVERALVLQFDRKSVGAESLF
ncbi:peptide chain release factor N(5)-glutamine methyltransferase [Neokomagataea tanensis]|uniref:Release factor glutamine methyltransferase n=2 Tax=Neokomagataea TaxID=1223423 RepID=A0A4Y6VB17_9PROT|nr:MULTISPECIES: peptide chain release factor N(5)-glutamine methyltransferase [Neokomagataea]QDH25716.1 peptide chain release factor N(5)-glutamine methyltransferase [Neokomagataea tanensis]